MDLPAEHTPVATPMPDPPSGDFMTVEQWETIFALLDGSDDEAFRLDVLNTLAITPQRKQLAKIMNLLGYVA